MQKYTEKIFTYSPYGYIPSDVNGQPAGIRRKDMASAFACFKIVNCCNCFQSAEVQLVPLDQILVLFFTCIIFLKGQKNCFCQ